MRTILSRGFAAKVNYYEVLGVTPQASIQEVKAAYRQLVRQFHPDIAQTPTSQERFRLITEAYTVLSNLQSRATYDLTKGSKDEIQSILNKKRDKTGLDVEMPKYQPHEYGYKRLKELAAERKKYNLDKFYKFKGGLPMKDQGSIRGTGGGIPGEKARTNLLNNYTRDGRSMAFESEYIDENEADLFKISKNLDSQKITKKYPYVPAEIDYNWLKFPWFVKYFLFYLGLGTVLGGIYMSDEIPKAWNRQKIQELKKKAEAPGRTVTIAGMKALSL